MSKFQQKKAPKEDFLEMISQAFHNAGFDEDFEEQKWEKEQKPLIKEELRIWVDNNKKRDNNANYFSFLKGRLFEYFVVKKISEDLPNLKFLTWRSDKFIHKNDATIPQTNGFPDLLYEYERSTGDNSGFNKGDRIAVECKWTDNNLLNTINKNHDAYYPSGALHDLACSFYLAIGCGWENNGPKELYFIPETKIKIEKYNSTDELSEYKINGHLLVNKNDSLITDLVETEYETVNKKTQTIENLHKDLGLDKDR